jgi:predicted nuclease of predicted toxin-antitoxin system
LALDEASDSEIWKFATEKGYVLITKDEDFSQRASLPKATVQVVWVRLGNCRKDVLLAAFDSVISQMHSALESGNRVIEIR